MKQYFKSRNGWNLHTEKKLRKQAELLETYWSRIFGQRIQMERKSVEIEKDAIIELLERELSSKKNENLKLKASDLEVEKLKNELRSKIQHLDFQTGLIGEMHSRLSVQIGTNDLMIRQSEDLLDK